MSYGFCIPDNPRDHVAVAMSVHAHDPLSSHRVRLLSLMGRACPSARASCMVSQSAHAADAPPGEMEPATGNAVSGVLRLPLV